jgi:hypothetical protein
MARQERAGLWTIAGVAALALMGQSAASAGESGCMGECYEPVAPKVIHRTLKYRVQTEQGEYEIARKPSLYGWAEKPVFEWRDAEYRTVTVRERLPRWEWRHCSVGGREVMCKVRAPGGVVEREKTLMTPPGYVQTGYEQRRILIRPYKNIAIYHRARNEYVTVRAAIQPEGVAWRRVKGEGCAYCD